MNLTRTPRLALRFGTWGDRGKLIYSNQVLAVSGFRDASEKWSELRDRTGVGSSNSPIVVVVDTDNGEHVAKVSYNGRVWGADGKEIAL